jgi:signal transduction histidine kinase
MHARNAGSWNTEVETRAPRLQYKPDDLVYDKVRSFASIIHPEDRAAAMESAASSLKDSGQYKIEYRVICANGSIKWLSEQGIQIDFNGPIIEGSILDITELRKHEEELLRHKNNLQNIVDIHTKEVMRKVKQASRAKSDFLSNMSHELRTPMHAILRFADMSLTACDEKQPDLVKRYINNIRISGDRLLRLINDILDMSKLESGKMNYKK